MSKMGEGEDVLDLLLEFKAKADTTIDLQFCNGFSCLNLKTIEFSRMAYKNIPFPYNLHKFHLFSSISIYIINQNRFMFVNPIS